MGANSTNCPTHKIDSNVVGSSYAEEKCIGQLPDGVAPDDELGAIWRPVDPNEFDDFGGEITMVARNPISSSRQRKKGIVTNVEATGGLNIDVTPSSLPRLMQGFCFADAREGQSTAPISDDITKTVTVTSVVGAGTVLNVGAGDGARFKVGDILKLSGFTNPANNRSDIIVNAIAGDALSVAGAFVDETATAEVKLETVGFKFAVSSLRIDVVGAAVSLTRSSGSFIDDNYHVGEWLFIGGDLAPNQFGLNKPGYARVHAVTAGKLTLKEPTWAAPATDVGATKTIHIYRGTYIRNENDVSLIKRRTYHWERTLGQDNNGVQSEYLVGSVANEFSLNITAADKMTADLSYYAQTNELRNGLQGLKAGDRSETISATEDAYNTSSNVYQMRLFIDDPDTITPGSIYAKVMESTVTINNGASGLNAIGDLGSFDINIGDFEVGGEIEAYFSTVEAVRAVKNNADVGFNIVAANDNTGFIFDIPLLSLGGGKVTVEKDEPIKLPVETSGAENENGYTLSCTFFGYLPDIAMPTVV